MKLQDIAQALGGHLVGDGTLEVTRPVHPAEARAATDLALALEPKLVALLAASPARAAVVADGVEVPEGAVDGYVAVPRPRYAMAGLTGLFERPVHYQPGIHATAVIAPDASLGQGVAIGPFVVIGARAVIGDRSVILSHCSIGADGFSFVTPEPGSVEAAKATGRVDATNQVIRRINSLGAVVLGDDVEVGANAAIDRGTISDTRIGRHTKIDNLVQIGHNVTVGDTCMICGQVGIAGSATIGNRVVLAGQVGVGDHVTIGDDVVVGAKSAVGTDVASRSVVLGIPAQPRDRMFDQLIHLNRLKGLFAEVAQLKGRLKTVEQSLEKD